MKFENATFSTERTGTLNTSTAADVAGIEPKDFLWIDTSINQNNTRDDDYASAFHAERALLVIGADLLRNQTDRFGLGVSHGTTKVAGSAGGAGAVRETSGFVYGQHVLDAVIIDGIAAYGSSQWTTGRDDPLQGSSLKTDEGGHNRLVGVGVRYPIHLATATVEPFVRVLWQNVRRGAADEGVASSAALSLEQYSASGTRYLAGLAGGSDKRDPGAEAFTYQYSAALGADSSDLGRPEVYTTLANSEMIIVAPHTDRAFLQANLSGTAMFSPGAYGYVGITSEVRGGSTDIGANAGLKISF